MSFRCTSCGRSSRPPHEKGKQKPIRFVSETRLKVYPGGGHGREIVREEKLCEECGKQGKETRPGGPAASIS